MTNHFDDKGLWVAALPEGDAEKVDAFDHARSCDRCRRALAQGARALGAVDAALALQAGSDEADRMDRWAAIVERRIAAQERRLAALPVVAVLFAWSFELIIARKLADDPGSWAMSAVVALFAVVLIAWKRLGWTAVGAAVALSASFALLVGSENAFAAAIGVKCTLLEILAASFPWAAFIATAREGATPARGAAVAAAGALAGQAALHLSCPVRHAEPHLLAFHLGGVLLACALGGWVTPLVRKVFPAG